MLNRFKYDNFIDFSNAVSEVFSDTEFLDSLPREAMEYEIIMFPDKKDLKVHLHRISNENETYIVLSDCVPGSSSQSDIVVMFQGKISDSFNKVCIGGCL